MYRAGALHCPFAGLGAARFDVPPNQNIGGSPDIPGGIDASAPTHRQHGDRGVDGGSSGTFRTPHVILWIETMRIGLPSEEGYGLARGAIVCSHGYHFNMNLDELGN